MENNNPKKIGRVPEVSDLEIIEAGKKLVATNKNTSGTALRKMIGGRGDPYRLKRIWTEYESAQAIEDNSANELTPEIKNEIDEATSTLSKTFESLVLNIYKKANNEAQAYISSAINFSQNRQKAADEELHDAAIIIEDLEQELSLNTEHQNKNDSIIEELETVNNELSETLREHERELEAQCNLLEIAAKENEQLVKIADLKERHIETLTQNIADLKADSAVLQKESEVLKLELLKKAKINSPKLEMLLERIETEIDDAA